jgi:hypothetical protein
MIRMTGLLVMLLPLFAGFASAQSVEQIEAYEQRINEQQQQLDAMRADLEALKKMAGIPDATDEQQHPALVADQAVATNTDYQPFVVRRSENGVLSLGGRIHRVVMQVDDGASRNGFFMDSDQGPTMLRADFTTATSTDWSLSAALEVGIQSNRAFRVSQDDPNPGTDITVREADIELEHERFGKFSFGRGFSAAWTTSEIDLSGTVPSALIAVGNLAPGMKFVDRVSNQLSTITVSQHFADTERLLLVDRFRYDSPAFGGGFQLSGTLAADARWDTALRWYPTSDNWTVRAAATYEHKPFRDLNNRINVGISARHNDTGLSLTTGASRGEALTGREGTGFVIKGGWLTNLNSLGTTAFSVDYLASENVLQDDDGSDSVGFFVQQNWAAVGLDLYGGFRRYEVERPDIDLKPINVFALGAMYTF